MCGRACGLATSTSPTPPCSDEPQKHSKKSPLHHLVETVSKNARRGAVVLQRKAVLFVLLREEEGLLRIKSWEAAYLLLGPGSGFQSGWRCSCWLGLVGPGTAAACCCRRTTGSCLSRATHKAGHSLVLPTLDSGRQTLS